MNDTLIIQFAKHPKPGHVKTRLIPLLGEDGACETHMQLMTLTYEAAKSCDWADYQFWVDKPFDSTGLPDSNNQQIQQGQNLGDRMAHALLKGASQYQKVLLVGSDCPIFNQENINEARQLLDQNDFVLTPSNDGGYVLIGINQGINPNLANIDWGTETVMESTIQNVKAQGYKVGLATPLFDIDEPKDYKMWQKQ